LVASPGRIAQRLSHVDNKNKENHMRFPALLVFCLSTITYPVLAAPPTGVSTLSSLQSAIDALSARVATLEAGMAASNARVGTLETGAAATGGRVTTLEIGATAMDGRLGKLEGTISQADLVGTYVMSGLQTEYGAGPGIGRSAGYVFTGTLVLNADGTANLSATESGARLFFSVNGGVLNASATAYSNPPEANNFTWTYANNTFALNGGPGVTVLPGGKMLIIVGNNPSDFTQHLLLFTKR
jgi:hypothetical protein